ncbi:putative ATP-binding protein involved in virulence [Rhodococcus sp. SMB37]|uniref:AAA family ATPase n=1 Tax=Rhodococcus sp. SMB37 TaxID=2512213 RepID=UPI001049C3B5|nr:AAA family ATPase [Rhodococcus sp. SMB37]TCN55926.1 putative ATP-binding protein involved in virulence [Rhodococcus sp. SMB37]
MAFIKEFTITNLAGQVGRTHRVLDRNVNVFWGLNGRGKTTLLEILNCALFNRTDSLEHLPFEEAEIVFHSENFDADICRRFSRNSTPQPPSPEEAEFELLSDLSTDDDVFALTSPVSERWSSEEVNSSHLSDNQLSSRYKHTYLPISRAVPGRPTLRNRRPDSHPSYSDPTPEEIFVDQIQRVWRQYSSQSNASIRSIQQKGLATVLAILFGGESIDEIPVHSNQSADQAYNLVQYFLKEQNLHLPFGKKRFIERYNSSKEHRAVAAEIEAVRTIVDEILAPQRELQSLIDEMYTGNKHLTLDPPTLRKPHSIGVEVEGGMIPLRSLSSGEKQLLTLLIEVLAVGESTVMIDEPELSLHVDWQQQLIPSMRRINPNAQLLLATHSPEIMIDVDDECVFEL